MEELCAPQFKRILITLRRCLDESGLKKEDNSEIELIGGSTRISAVKLVIEHFFLEKLLPRILIITSVLRVAL